MPRILIAEDEADMAAGLRDNLQFEGYDVVVAGEGSGDPMNAPLSSDVYAARRSVLLGTMCLYIRAVAAGAEPGLHRDYG